MRRRTTLLSVLVAAAMGLGGLFLVTAGSASAYTAGSWKVSCTVSHSVADDPIVLPNRPGASHLHDFFGNASTNAMSTYESMQGVRSTCPNQDRSSYWVPALYQNGKKVNPSGVTVYYVSPVTDQSTIEAFPPNFRMIAGDAKNADPAKMSGHIQWGCLGNTQIGRVVPAACPDADGIQARITFPSCWNGVTAPNGGNNAVNMRFPSRNTCPAGFGRVFPTVRMNVAYLLGKTTGTVTLSSGAWPSIHADFLNVWHQPTLDGLVKRCLHGKINCEHFKGTTTGTAPAAHPKVAANQKPATAATKPATSPKPGSGGAKPAAATPPPTGAAAPAAAASTPAAAVAPATVPSTPSAAGEQVGAAPGAAALAPDAPAPGARGQGSGWAPPWKLVSDSGTVNAPVVAGVGLLIAGFLVLGTVLFRGARRRVAPAGAQRPAGRPGTG